MALKEIKERC